MKRNVVIGLIIGALSVSMLVGCGSDKEVTKVDDNTVQITDVSTEADNGTETDNGTEETNVVGEATSANIVEELGLEVHEGDYFRDGSDDPEIYASFIAGMIENNALTGETRNRPISIDIYSTEYTVAEENSSDGQGPAPGGSGAAVIDIIGTNISPEPEKEGYVKTFFQARVNHIVGYDFTTSCGVYDRSTGICFIPSVTGCTEDGELAATVTVAVDGVKYDCISEASIEYVDYGDDTGSFYITMAVEHPAEYDANNILFVIGSPTVEYENYMAALEDTDESNSNLRDQLEMWNLCNGTFYAYK